MSACALFVGDVALDFTCGIDHLPKPDEKVHMHMSMEDVGGVVANAAVACQMAGTDVRLVCHIGTDQAGVFALQMLRSRLHEVAERLIEGRSPRVVILIEPHGEKRLVLDPGDTFFPDEKTLSQVDLGNIQWMHTAVYGPAIFELVERCRRHGIAWSVDLEPATFTTGIGSLSAALEGAEIVFCNDNAADALKGDAVALLQSAGVKWVVRTRGAKGVELYGRDEAYHAVVDSTAPVLDTTGAGDCLAGWLISKRIAGASVTDQLRYAAAAATYSCSGYGAQSSFPSSDLLDISGATVNRL